MDILLPVQLPHLKVLFAALQPDTTTTTEHCGFIGQQQAQPSFAGTSSQPAVPHFSPPAGGSAYCTTPHHTTCTRKHQHLISRLHGFGKPSTSSCNLLSHACNTCSQLKGACTSQRGTEMGGTNSVTGEHTHLLETQGGCAQSALSGTNYLLERRVTCTLLQDPVGASNMSTTWWGRLGREHTEWCFWPPASRTRSSCTP
jgi:hypothetical protein